MYQVVLNGKDKLQIEVTKEGIMIDGSKIDWDLHQVDDHTYHLIHSQGLWHTGLQTQSNPPSWYVCHRPWGRGRSIS